MKSKHPPHVNAAIDVVHSALRHLTPSEREIVLDAAASPTEADARRAVDDALRENGNDAAKAAAQLGISTRALQKRMRKLGLPELRRGRKAAPLEPEPIPGEAKHAIAERISARKH